MKKGHSSGGIGTNGWIDAKRSSHGLTTKSWQSSKDQQHLPLESGRSAGWSAVSNGPSFGGPWRSIESGFSTSMEARQVSGKSWYLRTTM